MNNYLTLIPFENSQTPSLLPKHLLELNTAQQILIALFQILKLTIKFFPFIYSL